MKKVSGMLGATLLFAGPAFAADLGVRAQVMTLGPVSALTGFYIGGNVGYGWDNQAVNFSGDPVIGRLIANGLVASSLHRLPAVQEVQLEASKQATTGRRGPSSLASRPTSTPRPSPRVSPSRFSVLQRALKIGRAHV